LRSFNPIETSAYLFFARMVTVVWESSFSLLHALSKVSPEILSPYQQPLSRIQGGGKREFHPPSFPLPFLTVQEVASSGRSSPVVTKSDQTLFSAPSPSSQFSFRQLDRFSFGGRSPLTVFPGSPATCISSFQPLNVDLHPLDPFNFPPPRLASSPPPRSSQFPVQSQCQCPPLSLQRLSSLLLPRPRMEVCPYREPNLPSQTRPERAFTVSPFLSTICR